MTNPAYEATNSDVEKLIAPYESKFSRLWERFDEACHGNAEHMRDILEATLNALEGAESDIAVLTSALEQAQQDGEELTKFKEVMTQAAHAVKDGNPIDLESMFKGELASEMFATMFAGEFVRHGAKNYLELLYAVPDFGGFTVTIQKKDGITPCERIAELESAPNGMMQLSNELAEMKQTVSRLRGERDTMLRDRLNNMESRPLCVKSNDAMREAAPLCVKLPDSSSKAFWSGVGKTEKFHPETYKRWVKEAIERAGDIAGIQVEVK